MPTTFRGREGSASIVPVTGGFMLTLRDRGGHIFRRRRHDTYESAERALWRYDSAWSVAR